MGFTVMKTVPVNDVSSPSDTLKIRLSLPLNPSDGV